MKGHAGLGAWWLVWALLVPWGRIHGDVPVPPSPFEHCDAELLDRGAGWNGCGCFYTVGVQRGVHDAAARRLEALLDDPRHGSCARFNLGRLRLLAGGDGALPLLREAAKDFAREGEAEAEVYARLNASRAARRASLDSEAAAELDRARQVAQTSGHRTLSAQVLLQQSRLALARGENLDRVAEMLLETSREAEGLDSPSLWRDLHLARGNVSYLLGRFDEAEGFYGRMAEVCGRAGDAYGEATALMNRAMARMAPGPEPGSRDEVSRLLQDALDAALEAGQREAEAEARLRLGMLAQGSGDAGRGELSQALDMARQLGATAIESRALAALAASWAVDDPTRARHLAAESARVAEESPHYGSSAYGWAGRMEVAWRTGSVAEAAAAGLGAIDRVEDLRLLQRSTGERAEVFAVWTELYYALAGRLLEVVDDPSYSEAVRQDASVAAFQVVERMRARVLLESLDAAEVDGTARAKPFEFADLASVQAALRPNEALWSFQVAPWTNIYGTHAGGAWAILVTRSKVQIHRIHGRHRLESMLRIFRTLIERRDGSEAVAAQRLYGELLAPLAAQVPAGVDHWIVVPDGVLHRLPFALLRDAEGRFLAQHIRLSTVPSATFWVRQRATEATPSTSGDSRLPSGVLALADPVVSDLGEDVLPPLPAARREARIAVRQLGGRALLGDDAGEAILHAEWIDDYAALHLAAHAVVDPQHPENSSVRLAAGSGEDGSLTPGEIVDLELTDRLVVLSACRSAAGRLVAGEGPLSLARAFFEARARGVVASLWPLRDDEAAQFFTDFYAGLAAGESVAGAVVSAQRASIERGDPATAWAGVVVFGDGEFEVESRDSISNFSTGLRPWTLLGSTLIVLELLGWVLRRQVARPRGRP